jgi:PAS domain S-box-containing protein
MNPVPFNFLAGGGEMGGLIRTHDWNTTPLGSPESWPQGLRTALRVLLTSQHPMFIWWGPELIQFYNDAYRKTMGPERHPSALGQPGRACWEEIWDIIGPQIEQVMAGQGATWNEDHLVPVTRHGRRENVWWTYGYSPIDDETNPGGVGGVLVICNDVTAQHEATDALKVSRDALQAGQNYFRLILDSAADPFYCVGRQGEATLCNQSFLKMLGFADSSEVLGKSLHHVAHHSHADGTPYPLEDCPIWRCVQTGAPQHVENEILFRRDGTKVPVEYWVRPILRDGEIQGAICNFQDISARQEAAERQNLLLRELNHRVKNLFAVMNGIVALSARSGGSGKQIAEAIRGRLSALASANDLILPDTMRGRDARSTNLGALADAVLAPYGGIRDASKAERVVITGPAVQIGDKTATSLALVLHEFATNAAKYGALSGETGNVTLDWRMEDGALRLAWRERGGPRIDGEPAARGFGSVLATRSVEGQLGGKLTYSWLPEGLEIALQAPAEHLDA